MNARCYETAGVCECILDEGHDGPHTCEPGCGGQWEGEFGTDSWKVVTFPGGPLIARLLGRLA
jgi:hypothetical protein